ncbi:hypothetical protein BJ508DRAFT_360286 [Ascobolus immersus RN42]|uniref:Protein transport protein Sec61 subunit beta n=1 Tax=Ascobolus immersus RN42 TaxID=1160509 RepID=A0A3N4IDG8_ASCIM|nr:hypothetical protein BJ508DRAFT_360286 [Ascobolus immersus RN42]
MASVLAQGSERDLVTSARHHQNPLLNRVPSPLIFYISSQNTSTMSSSPRAESPAAATGAERAARPASPSVPGGPKTVLRRRKAADRATAAANQRPSSTRAAGAGGSSSTMLKLYTDESPGLKVDPVIVIALSIGFIFSVVALHVIAKLTKRFAA